MPLNTATHISDILSASRSILAHSDILPLLSFVLKRSKEFILTHPEYILSKSEKVAWERVKKRRACGEPVAYITGVKEFYSLTFQVNRHTLIPRPETETLVEEIAALHPASMLDVGTGCGAIAVSVKFHVPDCRVTAIDIDRKAVRIAACNAKNLLGNNKIIFIKSDYFKKLSGQCFDVIASNPPYVKTGEFAGLQPGIRLFEPARALDGGKDGLTAYRVLLSESQTHLNPDGLLIIEISPDLKDDVTNLGIGHGWKVKKVLQDLSGYDRVMVLTPG